MEPIEKPPVVEGLNFGGPPTGVEFRSTLEAFIRQCHVVEGEKNAWLQEKADLQKRITDLEKESRSFERTKVDLNRRIQMLEYAVRLERAKHASGKKSGEHSGESVPSRVAGAGGNGKRPVLASKFFTLPSPNQLAGPLPKGFLRDMLAGRDAKGLDPIHESKTEAKSADDDGRLKVVPNRAVVAGKGLIRVKSPSHAAGRPSPPTSAQARNTPPAPITVTKPDSPKVPHASHDKHDKETAAVNPAAAGKQTGADSHAAVKSEAKQPAVLPPMPVPTGEKPSGPTEGQLMASDVLKMLDAKVAAMTSDGKERPAAKTWKPKLALRNHLDGVRAVCWDDVQVVLLSGSEDGSAKFWNLSTPLHPMNKKKVFTNLEPVYTFLGHKGMITSVGIKSKDNICFTAGIDARLIIWQTPTLNQDAYDAFNKLNVFKKAELGHGDAVWDLAVHPGDSNLIFTACADGSIYSWKTDGSSENSVQNIRHPQAKAPATDGTFEWPSHIPSSVSVLQSDTSKLLVSYTNGQLAYVDVETGKVISILSDSSGSATDAQGKRITKVVSHPTLSLGFTGHLDHNIRFWDVKQGACVSVMKAHRDCVTSLSVDSSGLYLASGGHDQSIRFWDLTIQKIVQDLDPHQTHRSKYDEAVHTVCYHPAYEVVASGGADSIIKIYA